MTLIEMKADGAELIAPTVERDAPNVIDIMAALEASVAAAKAGRERHPAAPLHDDAAGPREEGGEGGDGEVGGGEVGGRGAARKKAAAKKTATKKAVAKKAARKQTATKKSA